MQTSCMQEGFVPLQQYKQCPSKSKGIWQPCFCLSFPYTTVHAFEAGTLKLGFSNAQKQVHVSKRTCRKHCSGWEFQIIFGSSSFKWHRLPKFMDSFDTDVRLRFEWVEFGSQYNIQFYLTQTTARRASLLLCISQSIYRLQFYSTLLCSSEFISYARCSTCSVYVLHLAGLEFLLSDRLISLVLLGEDDKVEKNMGHTSWIMTPIRLST